MSVMVMMKVDDASGSGCEIISDYKFRSPMEHPHSVCPLFGDASHVIVTVPKRHVSSKQVLNASKPYKDRLCSPLGDDGYITDSMSSMAGSSLSSSLSSSWTDRGHVYAGTGQGKATSHTDSDYLYSRMVQSGIDRAKDVNKAGSSKTKIQLEPAQDGSESPEHNRVVCQYLGHDTRRRDASLETSNSGSCLEDRLGSLTTIDEEIPGASNDNCRVNTHCGWDRFDLCNGARIQQNAVHSPDTRRYKKRSKKVNPNLRRDSNYEYADPDCYRAVPLAAVATDSLPVSPNTPDHRPEEVQCSNGARSLCYRIGSVDSLLTSPPRQMNGEGWRVYSRLLEKHFDIPPHNIDPAGRGKFVQANVDDSPDMETKRQISTSSPAQHTRGERMKPNISGSRVLRVSGSEFSLHSLGQSNHSVSYQKSCQPAQGLARSDSEFDNGTYSRGMSFSQPRQNHVRSSMPDLRCHDASWLSERDFEFMPGGFHGNRFHHCQQSQQQNYEQFQPPDNSRCCLPQQLYSLPAIMDQCTQTHGNYYPCLRIREYAQSAPPGNVSDSLASLSYQHCPEISLRQHFSHKVASPIRAERSASSYDQPYLVTNSNPTALKVERHSLDLCNIPQLQKQIRATSELCLQASRRHMFASSADIHKLFSGQIKPPKSMSSSSGQFWDSLQSTRRDPGSSVQRNSNLMSPLTAKEIPRRIIDQRLISTPAEFVQSIPPSGPPRTDHCFRIPPETSVHNTPLSSSQSSEKDTSVSPTLHEPIEIYPDTKRHPVQRKESSCADAETEQLQLQRQLSDYSSETELQLIESNAEAVKNCQGIQESGLLLNGSAKNVTPINTPLENHPKTRSAQHATTTEPVYANGTVLATTVYDAGNESSNSDWYREPAARAQPSTISYINPYFTPALSQSSESVYANRYITPLPPQPSANAHTPHHLPSQPSANAHITHHLPSANLTAHGPARFQPSDNIDSSNSINGDSSATCYDNNFSNNPISYPHLPATQNQAIPIQTATKNRSSTARYYKQHNNNINHILYTNTRATPPSKNADIITSNPRFGHPVRQSASFHDFSVPFSNGGDFCSPASYLHAGHSMTGRNHSSVHAYVPGSFLRNGYSSAGRHSVLEKQQKLNFPFETNVVSEEEGDRLSTLV